jgi:3-mercaptopyruvate sulfurtransferase SseA
VAQKLQKLGIQRVRPLLGGFHMWKDLGYPLAEPTVVAWHTAVQPAHAAEPSANQLDR